MLINKIYPDTSTVVIEAWDERWREVAIASYDEENCRYNPEYIKSNKFYFE